MARPQTAVVCVAVALVCVTDDRAAAQTPPPPTVTQTVIVTATASPIPLELASRTVTVLTREELDPFGIGSVLDALRLVPALDVRARGPRDVQTDFTIRGSTFGQNLVLVDGVRLNNSQSGHHNGEIPLPWSAVDRIEVAAGPASAVHGADALGGTINIIARRDAHAAGSLTAGQFGYLATQASVSGIGLPDGWVLSGWAGRSGGYATERDADVGDFAQGGVALRAPVVRGLTVDLHHQRRAFGANGFYGASPSFEWTDQTLAAGTFRGITGLWMTEVRGAYRRHHDHFRWDINRPGFAENRHRTDASDVGVVAHRELGGGRRVSLGSGGGRDTIWSSNLGNHQYDRVHGFTELQAPAGRRALVQAGVRFDSYSNFGRAWSPTLSASTWVGNRLKVRASAGRAFRVPTFTELYYRDPAHQAEGDLVPEQGWSLDGGVELTARGWTLVASPFVRWDEDVIDWVKEEPADLWRTTNVRDVTTGGIEISASRRWAASHVRLFVSRLGVEAPDLTRLSKYVLEYAPWAVGGSITTPLGDRVRLSVTADFRDRLDGQTYMLIGTRLSRTAGRADLFVDVSNLLNETYTEIAGVRMPGRWFTAGVAIR